MPGKLRSLRELVRAASEQPVPEAVREHIEAKPNKGRASLEARARGRK